MMKQMNGDFQVRVQRGSTRKLGSQNKNKESLRGVHTGPTKDLGSQNKNKESLRGIHTGPKKMMGSRNNAGITGFPILCFLLVAIFGVSCNGACTDATSSRNRTWSTWSSYSNSVGGNPWVEIEKAKEVGERDENGKIIEDGHSVPKAFMDAVVRKFQKDFNCAQSDLDLEGALETWFDILITKDVEEIGKGKATTIYKCKDTIMSEIKDAQGNPKHPEYYAVKALSKDLIETTPVNRKDTFESYISYVDCPAMEHTFGRELRAFVALGRFDATKNNIVNFHSAWESSDNYYIVLECGAKDFSGMKNIKETTAMHYGKSIVTALSFMHKKGVPHRDLKPENLLLTKDGELKILDFGESDGMDENGLVSDPDMRIIGTPGYMAPEILEQKDWKEFKVGVKVSYKGDVWEVTQDVVEKKFGMSFVECMKDGKKEDIWTEDEALTIGYAYEAAKVDVWTLGLCLWHMLVKPVYEDSNSPFEPLDYTEERRGENGAFTESFSEAIHKNVLRYTKGEFNPFETHAERLTNLSAETIELLKKCLHPDPKQRYSLEDLSKNVWLDKCDILEKHELTQIIRKAEANPADGGLWALTQAREKLDKLKQRLDNPEKPRRSSYAAKRGPRRFPGRR